MAGGNPNSAGSSAEAAGLAPDIFNSLLSTGATPEQFCALLAKIFQVRPAEIALYRLENKFLRFLFPVELTTAGTIPLSSSTAVSAYTASSRKAEIFNTFAKVKHASVFEQVKLKPGENEPSTSGSIQKLMSAPVLDEKGEVLGVIQVCRKGYDPPSAGPDFSLHDLQRLELAAKALSQAKFMVA